MSAFGEWFSIGVVLWVVCYADKLMDWFFCVCVSCFLLLYLCFIEKIK